MLAPVFFLAPEADAQTGGCDVLTTTTRTTRPLGPNFFTESIRPYFYIDIGTQNCMGESIEVSITEDDSGVDDDVNGSLGLTETCSSNNNTCMDNRVINVTASTTNNFTLALITGEDECQASGDPDCQYHIETFDEVDDFEWTQVTGYDCDGVCGMNWQYLGIIPYNGTHPNDPDIANGNTGGGNNNNNPGGNTTGGGTATTTSAPTVINLNLVNPIANTVGSIPQFFQKLIDLIIKIAIPFVAIVLVYCGLLFVTARGDTSQIEKARNAFTYAIIGGLVLLSSWLIAEAIRDALINLAYVI